MLIGKEEGQGDAETQWNYRNSKGVTEDGSGQAAGRVGQLGQARQGGRGEAVGDVLDDADAVILFETYLRWDESAEDDDKELGG